MTIWWQSQYHCSFSWAKSQDSCNQNNQGNFHEETYCQDANTTVLGQLIEQSLPPRLFGLAGKFESMNFSTKQPCMHWIYNVALTPTCHIDNSGMPQETSWGSRLNFLQEITQTMLPVLFWYQHPSPYINTSNYDIFGSFCPDDKFFCTSLVQSDWR